MQSTSLSSSADFIAVIPARMDSSRLPGKPLADIGGKPMVVRVAEQALRSGARHTVVATDSPQIVEACRDHGVEAMLTRNDHPSGTDRIAEVVSRLDLPDAAIVVNVQGDEPLIAPALITGVAQHLTAHADCAIATAAHAIDAASDVFNPNVVKTVLDARSRALLFSRAPLPWFRDGYAADARPAPAMLPMPVYRHIGIYAYRAGFLRRYPELPVAPLEQAESLEQLRAMWHGERIAVLIADAAPPAGVDTPEDLERVRLTWASGVA